MNTRKWFRLSWVLAIVATALIGVGVVLAADVVIDDFSEESLTVDISIPSNPTFPLAVQCLVTDTIPPANTLGGQRKICLEVTGGNSGSSAKLRADAENNYFDQELGTGVFARGFIQWDGSNSTNPQIDYEGLRKGGAKGEDLTDEGSNEGILVRVIGSDGRKSIFDLRIYHDEVNWMRKTLEFKSVVDEHQVVDVFFPFDSFEVQEGSMTPTAIAQDTGAIEFSFDVTSAAGAESGADIRVRLVKATSVYEYGDLPLAGTAGLPISNTGYSTAILNARHIPQGMRLGNNVDTESTHKASLLADGDDNSGVDDEDGVRRRNRAGGSDIHNWTPGSAPNGGKVGITVRGCSATRPCYVVGWIDWNQDGDFDDQNEKIGDGIYMSDQDLVHIPADQAHRFTIPTTVSFNNERYYARFRVCPAILNEDDPNDPYWEAGACNTPNATNVLDGEIEDYAWDWGTPVVPTAVTLAAFEAQPQANAVLVTWETAMELDNLGFNLYRSAAAAGPWTQLNAELIPAQHPGAVFGAVYEWLDADAAPGALAYYRLEDVDIHGVSAFHGPVSAAPLSPSAVRLSNFGAGAPFIGLALALGSLALFTGLKKRR